MERVKFGNTGLEVSPVVLGTWVAGGWAWGGSDDKDSVMAILRALELGINFIDTAPVYGFGRSEQVIAMALNQWGRQDRVILATKCGLDWDDKGNIRRNSSPERLRKELEDSLRRLAVDRVDIYQVHWPDGGTAFQETMETLLRMKEEGKIAHIGLSNFDREQLAECMRHGPVESLQPPFNMFERAAAADLLPYCLENGVATLVYGGLCRGLLTGKFMGDEQFPKGDLRRGDPKFKPDKFKQYVKAVEDVRKLASKYGKTPAQFALRWALHQPGVTTIIAGARTASQVEDNVGVSGWQIDKEDLDKVEEILSRRIKTPVGPEFMAPKNN